MNDQGEMFRFSGRFDTGPRGEAVEKEAFATAGTLPGDERANERADAYPDGRMPWRVHAPAVLREVVRNAGCANLRPPVELMMGLLEAVAERARVLGDYYLEALLCRLTLFAFADPDSPRYSPKAVADRMEEAMLSGPDVAPRWQQTVVPAWTPPPGAPVLVFKANNRPTEPGWYMGLAPNGIKVPSFYEVSVVSGRLHARQAHATTGRWLEQYGDAVLWTDRIAFDVPPEFRGDCKKLLTT